MPFAPKQIFSFCSSFIYWTDWGDTAAIEKISMDGDADTRVKLVTEGIVWPNGLTLDLAQRKLYWIDAKLKRVEVIDLDGKNRKMVRNKGALRSSLFIYLKHVISCHLDDVMY